MDIQIFSCKTISILIVLFCVTGQAFSSLPSVCPNIISRTRWGARSALEVEYSIIPIQYVVVHHTVTPECNTENKCSNLISNMQDFHMDELEFHDLGYNFVIGGDGNVYEGAGWHKVGAHTRGYNTRSLGIAFIGDFRDKLPNKKQLNAGKALMKCAMELGELDTRYKLIGGRQVSATQSPGLKLYHELQNWPHFARNPK